MTLIVHQRRAGACSRRDFHAVGMKIPLPQGKILCDDEPAVHVDPTFGGIHGGSKPPPYFLQFLLHIKPRVQFI